MKPLAFLSLLLPAVFFLLFSFVLHHHIFPGKNAGTGYILKDETPTGEKSRIEEKAAILKEYIKGKKFNTSYCFLVDMNMPSGKKRFFVFDLAGDSVILSGLVAHGHGKKGFSITPIFSNQEQSCCTALGKYRVGSHYQGQYGLAYKLYGLDTTNSEAYARNIVLHAYWCVPEKETDPFPICNSSGCPMVASEFLKELRPFIDKSRQAVLLWIFN